MNKTSALMNALAVFHFCLWKLPKALITLTRNSASFNVNVILDHEDYDSDIELEKMEAIIAAGAKIVNYKREGRDYDAIDITYYYQEDNNN